MPFRYRPKLNLTEREIRYAMSQTKSNAEAARFLKVSFPTWKKYAKLYKDEETGKTLYELHKNQEGKGIHKYSNHPWGKYVGIEGLLDILAGKYPEYSGINLKKRLIKEGVFSEECQQCGFHERRFTDGTVPLILVFKDGNKRNYIKDNLELLCYNCFYLCVGDVYRSHYADSLTFKEHGN